MNEQDKWLAIELKGIHSCGIYGLDDGPSVLNEAEFDIKMNEEKWMVLKGLDDGTSCGIYGLDDRTSVSMKQSII